MCIDSRVVVGVVCQINTPTWHRIYSMHQFIYKTLRKRAELLILTAFSAVHWVQLKHLKFPSVRPSLWSSEFGAHLGRTGCKFDSKCRIYIISHVQSLRLGYLGSFGVLWVHTKLCVKNVLKNYATDEQLLDWCNPAVIKYNTGRGSPNALLNTPPPVFLVLCALDHISSRPSPSTIGHFAPSIRLSSPTLDRETTTYIIYICPEMK